MPGVRSGGLLKKKPIFASEADFQDKNNNTDGMKTEVRSEYEARIHNGHAQPESGVPRRVESEPAMNWGNLEKKYNKIGRNGYNRKELAEHLRHLSVDSNSESTNLSGNSGGGGGTCEPQTNVVRSNTYAGRRDVSDPTTLQEKQIVSSRGTVRGFRNRVRAGIATFLHHQAGETLVSFLKQKI